MEGKTYITLMLLIVSFSFVSAQEYQIDISGLSNDKYNVGEEITFKIILLEEEAQVAQEVNYKLTDALNKKEITGKINSNKDISIKVEDDFPSGIWTITANYLDSEVKRTFTVGEKSEVEFLIEGDELIIRNMGNVRYTKTIQITIGSETNSYVQNIRAGEEKILKLISADGDYDIEVTDGETTISRQDVRLIGTGNVVGAVDKDLVGYTGFAGANDVENIGDRTTSLSKLPMALVFVGAMGILAGLVFVERKMAKKKGKK